jgi:predicted Zn-dependent peptidase
MNSRLSLLLRERNGIGYNVETNYTSFSDTGLFTIYYGTDATNIERSLRIVKRELERVCSVPFTELQMNKIKRQLSGQLLMTTVNGESQMLSVGRSALFFDVVDDIDEIVGRIKETTADDIFRVANKYINPQRLSSLIYK